MAVGDLQFNPSTGLASFNASTNRVQLVGSYPFPCAYCTGSPPSDIEVTLFGFTDCNCGAFGGAYNKTIAIGSNLNGTYLIPNVAECQYIKEFAGSWGPYVFSDNADCSSPYEERNYTSFRINVLDRGDNILFRFSLYDPSIATWLDPFHGTNGGWFELYYSGDEACMDTPNSIANPCTACAEGAKYNIGGATGVVTIAIL